MAEKEIIMDILSKRERNADKKKSLKLSKYSIIYLDILGYRQQIDYYGEQKFLEIIDEIFHTTILFIRVNQFLAGDIQYRIFSDNIVICLENTRYDQQTLSFIWTAMLLQLYFLVKGIFVRGAITHGQLYIDKEYIYGSGLVKAYELEDKYAIYPRIIVEENFYHDFPSHIDNNFLWEKDKEDIFLKDTDGFYFLNYLNMSFGLKFRNQDFEMHYHLIKDRLSKYHDRENILKKYLWCRKYHNEMCEKYQKSEYFIC